MAQLRLFERRGNRVPQRAEESRGHIAGGTYEIDILAIFEVLLHGEVQSGMGAWTDIVYTIRFTKAVCRTKPNALPAIRGVVLILV